MVDLPRFIRHAFCGPWTVRRHFSQSDLDAIEAHIKATEATHGGEIRVCIEADLDVSELVAGLSPAERSRNVFSHLRVWDTAQNNGVLLYVLLADRAFEIVADRAISQHISAPEWAEVSREIEAEFKAGRFLSGVKRGIDLIAHRISRHFPSGQRHSAELSDKPVIL
ncbi:MAG: TPM domain-containing protein [Deltaproteobacteria bacterium]|nr:TPM domain-containing protein [Deltaproteobacteria bacterium]